jgi:hypothetical protein
LKLLLSNEEDLVNYDGGGANLRRPTALPDTAAHDSIAGVNSYGPNPNGPN